MAHTVEFDYYATGEGRTIGVLCTMDRDPMEAAKRVFGAYLASGAKVSEGFVFDGEVAKVLVPDPVRKMLEGGGGHFDFHAVMHFNFS